ncbi:phage tail protein [Ligilactobacillus pobuzihii]|uniref:Ig-like domain-containing protein n=1 Tax=Ligilactobacillus pobuzihii TaxID=449659 RepID=UPI0019D1292A|nr:Ig-like domain-containing protein [Ligilactobacillus pobuzihii]MBN7275505.1 phage tail protein [Ligilactobacillus pobuzihii]
MADRANEYLKAVKDGKVVAVGEKGTKKVSINDLPANTDYKKGAIKIAFDKNNETKITDTTSDLLDDEAFKTLPVKITGVSLDKIELSVEEGATAQLKATASPSNATNKAVTWKSGNEATFTIDNNGKITAVKAGQATAVVTTKDGGKTAECKVTVTAKKA